MKKNTITLFFLLALGLASCVSHKELLILNDISLDADDTEAISNQNDMRLQPDDLLSVTVSSYNIEAAKPFNSMEAQSQTSAVELLSGYFVDSDGFIDLPIIGRFNVNKKTIAEVKDALVHELKTYLKDPVVNIRILNFKVSVLGEVKNPGTIRLTNKRLTIFEAIGMAGDLTAYSNRTNVIIIREKNGKRTTKRLNLQSKNIFSSPFYYLQQNDVVYVEPNKTKANTVADKSGRVLTYVSAAISLLTITLTLALRP